jgi:tRNA A37 N6-isopentenylltransferase MiaA
MLIRGDTGQGKTVLASCLAQSATKVVSLDGLVTQIAIGKYHHTEVQKFIRDEYDDENLSKIYYGIDQHGLTEEYAKMLAEGISRSDRLVVIEGLITEEQAAALTSELQDAAFLWDVQKRR